MKNTNGWQQETDNSRAAFAYLFSTARAAGTYFMRSRCFYSAGKVKESDAYSLVYHAIASQIRSVWHIMSDDYRLQVLQIMRKAARIERAEQLQIKWASIRFESERKTKSITG